MNTKKQAIIATVIFTLVSLVFLVSGWQKLAGSGMVRAMFAAMNISAYRIPLGLIEIIIIPTLLWKPLRTLGTLIATGYLGGAIMATLIIGMPPVMPGAMIVLLWVAYKLDNWVGWMHCGCGTCKVCTMTKSTKKNSNMCACKPDCACEKDACDCK